MQNYAVWVAIYDDGTVIHQSEENQYEDLDRERLVEFALHDMEGFTFIRVPFKKGQGKRLIWRRRRVNKDGLEYHFYIVGKKGGFVAVLKPNLEVVINDKFDKNSALLSPPEPVKGEI